MPDAPAQVFTWKTTARLCTSNTEEAAIYYEWLLRLPAGERPGRALAGIGVSAVEPPRLSAQGWIPEFHVAEVAAALARVAPRAESVLGKLDDRTALVVDPAGAVVGLVPQTGVDESAEPSRFTFDLSVIDAPEAEDFYCHLLDLQPVRVLDDPYGMRLLSDGTGVVAGLVEMHAVAGLSRVPTWILYFEVDSVEEHVSRAVQSGSRVRIPPDTSPFNRYAVLEDPWGNLFGFSTLLPAQGCAQLPVTAGERTLTLAEALQWGDEYAR